MSKASRVRHPAAVTPLAQRGPSCPLSAGKQNKRNVYFVGINVRQEVSSQRPYGLDVMNGGWVSSECPRQR